MFTKAESQHTQLCAKNTRNNLSSFRRNRALQIRDPQRQWDRCACVCVSNIIKSNWTWHLSPHLGRTDKATIVLDKAIKQIKYQNKPIKISFWSGFFHLARHFHRIWKKCNHLSWRSIAAHRFPKQIETKSIAFERTKTKKVQSKYCRK